MRHEVKPITHFNGDCCHPHPHPHYHHHHLHHGDGGCGCGSGGVGGSGGDGIVWLHPQPLGSLAVIPSHMTPRREEFIAPQTRSTPQNKMEQR